MSSTICSGKIYKRHSSAPSHKFRIPNWQNNMLSTWLHLIHLSETGKSVLFSRRKPQIRIPACQRLRQHSAYVPVPAPACHSPDSSCVAPACQRLAQDTASILAYVAMAGRCLCLLAMAGRCQRHGRRTTAMPAPACQRLARRATGMPSHMAMAGRHTAMAGRSKHVLFSRRKPQTNSNDKNINDQNIKIQG